MVEIYTGGTEKSPIVSRARRGSIIIHIGLSIICPRCCVITIGRATKAGAPLYTYGSASFFFLRTGSLFGQTSFFIKKHSAMPPPPPRGPQNTKYLLALISSSFFFCVTVCENKKNEGNHILLMMSFSMTQQDI